MGWMNDADANADANESENRVPKQTKGMRPPERKNRDETSGRTQRQ